VTAARFARGERVKTTAEAVPPQMPGTVVTVMKSLTKQGPNLYQVRIGSQKYVLSEDELEPR
jgi:hypothetical protein